MVGDILIPPSPNWFINNAMDGRSEDGILVTAAFKSVVVYQMLQERGLPKILKVIPYSSEKVQLVRLCPQFNHSEYGHAIACCGDGSTVRLLNMHTGDIIGYHKEHHDSSINGVSWGREGDEEVIVTVGGKGRMVVWQASHGTTRVHSISQATELSAVEVNPSERSQAIISGEKTIFLVELKDGSILTQLQGHNADIYCMKWFCGDGSPITDQAENNQTESSEDSYSGVEGERHKGSDSDNWRSKKVAPSFNGPFVVSSDYGRHVFLWDLTAKRYIAKVTVPLNSSSFSKKFQGKDKGQGKQHIALTWYDGGLISSTPKGELLQWKLWPGGGRFKALHHLHTRAIYNIEIINNVVITTGQDRVIHGFHIESSTHLFQYPTLGACASTLAFCPHDVNRLALGSQENNIRFINFESEVPLQAQTVWQNIKGKILSVSWHPEEEGKLLFGTGSGQVGWAEMSSGRVTTFAYYHQKSVYKVEWAPTVCPEKTSFSDTWCAYSFGDREIVIRSASDPMADPVKLLSLIPETEDSKLFKDITEFSFSPDYKYLAIGTNDGQVRIYQSSDMQLAVSLLVLRKAIQHVLWQLPTNSSIPYIVAVGSNETKICIFDLSSQLQGETSGEVLTHATRELCGHESRVVWLSWSPHKPEVLASASYDHTVQLWDTNTGMPLVNYGGHINRVFRVEFSPCDPDLMYSFAEENSVHEWKPSQLDCKTPKESLSSLKEIRPKAAKEQASAEEQANKEESSGSEKATTSGIANEKPTTSISAIIGSKKASYKSFFPKLHGVCSRKKSFYHLLILNLLGDRKEDKDEHQVQDKEFEEELSEDFEECDNKEVKEEITLASIKETSEKYGFLLEKDAEMAQPEEIAYALNLYGKPLQMDSLLTSEISEHETRGNNIQADLMHCWRGTLEDNIRTAARHKRLNTFLVSCSPQVSIKLWEFASEAYAKQLVEEGDIITGATYLVNINKVEDAIDILLKHRFFREAMAIAKCRLGYSEDLVNRIILAWSASTIFEGSFDFAAALQVSIGQIEDAARTMARRNDHGSLFIASQLYKHSGNEDLSKSIGLLALKEMCLKQEHDKVDHVLLHLPELQWFRAISDCHSMILKLLQQVMAKGALSSGYFLQKMNVKEKVQTETKSPQDTAEFVPVEGDDVLELPFLDSVKETWSNSGITSEQYPNLYETITYNFSTQQTPTSVKQLWFLVAVAVCELLISPTKDLWELHLTTALNYALSWGKADQIFHLTHALLPRGTSDLATLASQDLKDQDEATRAVSFLLQLYHTSETCLLHSHLQNDDIWSNLVKGSCDKENDITATESCNEEHSSTSVNISETKNNLPKSSEDSLEDIEVKEGLSDSVQEREEVQTVEFENTSDNKFCSIPRNSLELLKVLHYHTDFFIKDQDAHGMMEEISHSLLKPQKLLLEMSLKLKEDLGDDDARTLLCKVSSLKS